MAVGKAFRNLLPSAADVWVSEAYRRAFTDLDELGRTLQWVTRPRTILEVGCGEGAMAQRLTAIFPDAAYMGIDLAASPGSAFVGEQARVTFETIGVEEVHGRPQRFDLVLLVDVLHHVPLGERQQFLSTCSDLVIPGGTLIVKEWERRRNLAGALAYASDRYVTGDRGVAFWTRDELLEAVARSCPGAEMTYEARIPPRRNNLLLGLRMPVERSGA